MSHPSKAIARLVWLPWFAVLLLVVALTVVTLRVNKGMADRKTCEDNLRAIYAALDDYERFNAGLPRLDLYPANPRTDQDSLLVALAGYGLSLEAGHCPRAPASIGREHALTYLWNVELNGKLRRDVPRKTWMVIEITALNQDLKPPHFRKYNVLLADGTIVATRSVPDMLKSP